VDAVVLFLCGLKGSPQCSRISIVLGIRSIKGDMGSVLDKHPWSLNRCQPLFCSRATLIQSVREGERKRERGRESEREGESGRERERERQRERPADEVVPLRPRLPGWMCLCLCVCICTRLCVCACMCVCAHPCLCVQLQS
jgi:hypothetical protein